MIDKVEKPQLKSDKEILANIISTLIRNIENKSDGRWTSGINSEKVNQLAKIETTIRNQEGLNTGSKEHQEYLKEIMTICEQKRNSWHFWRTPDSVAEYRSLLAENKIQFNPLLNELKQ